MQFRIWEGWAIVDCILMHRSRATQQGCLITGGVSAVRLWVFRDLPPCVCVSEKSPSGSLS